MITATVLTDGSSDRALLPIIRWAFLKASIAAELQLQWAELRNLRNPPADLAGKIATAVSLYPCDILFVHRDAEGDQAITRYQEIENAINASGITLQHVPIVPVRMLEAWLLCEQDAIRRASGNPNGTCRLQLPRIPQREQLPNPKGALVELLRTASELSGRRLKKFDALRARALVAEYTEDFSCLRQLSSFQAFESDLTNALRSKGRNDDGRSVEIRDKRSVTRRINPN